MSVMTGMTTIISLVSTSTTVPWETEIISISNRVVILANLGPLTTTFTPSSYCSHIYYYTNGLDGSLAFTGSTSDTASECWPSSFVSAQYIDVSYIQPDIYGYYSPGICPSGYVTACADHTSLGGGYCCCPSGYGCYDSGFGYPRVCTSVVVGSAIETNIDKTEEVLTVTTGAIYTDAIRIRADNTPIMTAGTSGPRQTSGAGPSTPTNSTPTPGARKGIIIIAIAVVIPVVVAILLGALWYRRRVRRIGPAEVAAGPQRYELDSKSAPMVVVEADSGAVHELPSRGNNPPGPSPVVVVEMQSQEVHELQDIPYAVKNPSGCPVVAGEGGSGYDASVSPRSPPHTTENLPSASTDDPPSVILPEDEEMRWMRLEQEKLKERRERLQILERLEAEEEILRRRMQERRELLVGGSSTEPEP